MIRTTPHPLTGRQAPLTLGHEFSGRVVAADDADGAWPAGTRVTADACWRCGHCEACVERRLPPVPLRRLDRPALRRRLRAVRGRAGVHARARARTRVSDEAAAMTEPLAVGPSRARPRRRRGRGTACSSSASARSARPRRCWRGRSARRPSVVELDAGPARARRGARARHARRRRGPPAPRPPRGRRRRRAGRGRVHRRRPPCSRRRWSAPRRGGRIVAVGLTGEPARWTRAGSRSTSARSSGASATATTSRAW